MRPLVLASTSPYRRELLGRLGLPFTCEPPRVDEAAFKVPARRPPQVAVDLARAKAATVAARHPDAVVIGSDQVATVDDAILDKPGSVEAARAQLQRLQGRTHELVTAVAIAHGGGMVEFVDTTALAMRRLDDAAIARYVAADQPLDCAGSYRIEALGVTLFDRIECSDWTAIVGLPLLRLGAELRALGFALP
jgi:septum formation protein